MERVDANLVPFAKNNPSGYRFAFGTDTATDDINVNYNDNIKKGWGTTPNEFPEVEDFNAMAYTSSYLTAYLYQMGISEWNDKQNYRQYSRAMGSNGIVYKSKTGTDLAPNVNNNPITDSTNWEVDAQFNINTFTDKATPVDADNLAIQEAGGLFKKLSWSNLKATIISSFGVMTNTLTAKTTPVDADIFPIGDSASSNATKKITWANIKTALNALFAPLASPSFTGNPTAPTQTAENNSTRLATTAYVDGKMVLATAVNATSGTAIDFTSIPSWVDRITIMFNGVSTNGSSYIQIQLGDSGGIENSGYSCSLATFTSSTLGSNQFLTGFPIFVLNSSDSKNGSLILTRLNGNTWVGNGGFHSLGANPVTITMGSKTLSATLDRIRVTTVNGTDTFDGGSINIMYEG